jgi:hypothetical protein
MNGWNNAIVSLTQEVVAKLKENSQKKYYRVRYAFPSGKDMPQDQASFTISGLKTDTLYERDSLAVNIERFLNSLEKKK